MLCTMCCHGTTKFWKCDRCKETNCNHILTCKCGHTYRQQTLDHSNLTPQAKAWFAEKQDED